MILGVRPQTLATMVPKLLRGSLTPTSCRALGSLAEVAGPAIAPHLSNIFPPLLRLASQPEGASPASPAAKGALNKVRCLHPLQHSEACGPDHHAAETDQLLWLKPGMFIKVSALHEMHGMRYSKL